VYRKIIYSLFFSIILINSHAQELNCQVIINTSQIQGSANKQIFDQLQKSIFDFVNNRKWSNDIFGSQEKINCTFQIIINKSLGSDEYSASIQVESARPIYKSAYSSTIFNFQDDDFQFKFQQFSQLEFNENTFQNNLTSVLAYYAYVVLANDYDSFSPLGGTQYWQKAQQIVNNAQSANESGWVSSQSQRNRYWLVENTLQPVFKGLRDCMYEYNKNGLDIMFEKTDEGRAAILKSLDLLMPVYKSRPASFNMQLFFNAKADELVNIFKGASPEEKNKIMELLSTLDPSRTNKYSKIQGI
jgi:hypothetical protein